MLREPVSQVYEAYLRLPCGRCLGCAQRRAREWVLRCRFELQQHEATCWTTLTYDEEHCPPTLIKRDLSGFLKRLRARRSGSVVRFFGCGEYGERKGRPHYHAILFGVPQSDAEDVRACWKYGNVRVDPIAPAAIAYVAGYSAKKVGATRERYPRDVVDMSTGEVLPFQEPFVLMSRRPGLGAHVRRFSDSWKESAVLDGQAYPVPRYLHDSWRKSASDVEIEELAERRRLRGIQTARSREQLRVSERVASAKRDLSRLRRSVG